MYLTAQTHDPVCYRRLRGREAVAAATDRVMSWHTEANSQPHDTTALAGNSGGHAVPLASSAT